MAFDTLDHEILIQKLSIYGIIGTQIIRKLFKGYVSLMNNNSNITMSYDVPQGQGFEVTAICIVHQ